MICISDNVSVLYLQIKRMSVIFVVFSPTNMLTLIVESRPYIFSKIRILKNYTSLSSFKSMIIIYTNFYSTLMLFGTFYKNYINDKHNQAFELIALILLSLYMHIQKFYYLIIIAQYLLL